jgi:hypothetical protein
VSNTSDTDQQQKDDSTIVASVVVAVPEIVEDVPLPSKINEDEIRRKNSAPPRTCEPFVRDIFLTVPDLKRDRAASVDSCFTKVTSGVKTEEVQPVEGDLNLLSVPNSGAVRSRSVDIVLPTEQQARYKALALAGNMYNKG